MSKTKRFKFMNPRRILGNVDGHTSEVISGAALAFVLQGLGSGLLFILNVVIGRLLGAEGTGLYFLAFSVTSIGAVVAKLGLDNTLLRFVATGAAEKDWSQVKGVFTLGMTLAGVVSFGLSLLCLALSPWIAEFVFFEPELTEPLRWMSFGIFSFSVMTLLAECLKGLKRILNSMLVFWVLYPALSLLLIWPLVSLFGIVGASLAYVLGTGLAAGFGILYWHTATGKYDARAVPFPSERLWASCRPLWITSIINRALLPWAPLFLLGIWGTANDVGVFGAATRLSILVSFFLHAVNTILAPKFAEFYANGDLKTLECLARRAVLMLTLASSPLFLLLFFFGDWVMGLFGAEFVRGGTTLSILVVGQAVNTITGPVGALLMMSGHERDLKNTSLAVSILMVIFAVLLIPFYGIIGAAMASAIAMAGMSLLAAWLVRLRLGIILVPWWARQ